MNKIKNEVTLFQRYTSFKLKEIIEMKWETEKKILIYEWMWFSTAVSLKTESL